jgi:hypothetical protein
VRGLFGTWQAANDMSCERRACWCNTCLALDLSSLAQKDLCIARSRRVRETGDESEDELVRLRGRAVTRYGMHEDWRFFFAVLYAWDSKAYSVAATRCDDGGRMRYGKRKIPGFALWCDQGWRRGLLCVHTYSSNHVRRHGRAASRRRAYVHTYVQYCNLDVSGGSGRTCSSWVAGAVIKRRDKFAVCNNRGLPVVLPTTAW